jgi:hypothetical protein
MRSNYCNGPDYFRYLPASSFSGLRLLQCRTATAPFTGPVANKDDFKRVKDRVMRWNRKREIERLRNGARPIGRCTIIGLHGAPQSNCLRLSLTCHATILYWYCSTVYSAAHNDRHEIPSQRQTFASWIECSSSPW